MTNIRYSAYITNYIILKKNTIYKFILKKRKIKFRRNKEFKIKKNFKYSKCRFIEMWSGSPKVIQT